MATYIESIGVLLDNALGSSKVYLNHMPSTPDEVVVAIPRPGLSDQFTHDMQSIGRPSVQVISRAPLWATAWANAQLARDALKVHNVTVAGIRILAVQPDQALNDGGKDANKNTLVVFTVQVWLG